MTEPARTTTKRPLTPVGTAAWGLAVYGGTRVIASVLQSTSMAALVAQAVLAEWGTGRIGVTWSDRTFEEPPTASAMGKRAGVGAVVGVVLAGVVIALLASSRGILLERAVASTPAIAVGLIGAGLLAMRDELVLHGLLFRVMAKKDRAWPKVLACGLTSMAAAVGEGLSIRAVVVQGLLGLVFGALWARDRGAWMPWAANAAWQATTSLILSGGVSTAQNAMTSWGGAKAGPLGSDAAILALLPLAIVAIASVLRGNSPSDGAVG